MSCQLSFDIRGSTLSSSEFTSIIIPWNRKLVKTCNARRTVRIVEKKISKQRKKRSTFGEKVTHDKYKMENSTFVHCSPKTFKKIQFDMEYRNKIVDGLAQSQDTVFDEIVFSENIQDSHELLDDTIKETGDGKLAWLDAPTKLLISLVKELRPQVGKTFNLKNKKKMWQTISENLTAQGYSFNAVQVEMKYYSLERQYKKVQIHNNLTGRNRQTCQYQTELDDLFSDKKAIYPECVLDESASGSETQISFDDTEESSSEVPNLAPENLKHIRWKAKKRKTVQEQLLQRVNTMADEKKVYESKILNLLQEKTKKREERAEREEELKKRKLDLLESLINVIKNK